MREIDINRMMSQLGISPTQIEVWLSKQAQAENSAETCTGHAAALTFSEYLAADAKEDRAISISMN